MNDREIEDSLNRRRSCPTWGTLDQSCTKGAIGHFFLQTRKIASSAWQRHRIPLLLVAALQVGDIASTHLALGIGLDEGNPVPAAMLTATGEIGMYAWKLLTVAIFLILICRLELRFTRAQAWHAVAAFNAITFAVVLSNLAQLV